MKLENAKFIMFSLGTGRLRSTMKLSFYQNRSNVFTDLRVTLAPAQISRARIAPDCQPGAAVCVC